MPATRLTEPDTPVVDNPALSTSLKAFASLTKEQKAVLAQTLDGFISCLAPTQGNPHANPQARTVITPESWKNRANWAHHEWNAWETWGWYRHFCRLVSARSFFRSSSEWLNVSLVLTLPTVVHSDALCGFVCQV